MIENVAAILIGRFLQGFAGGIYNMINAKSIFEVVPEQYNGVMGCLTNVLILFWGMLCTIIGMTIPTEPEAMEEDGMWRFVYSFPLVVLTSQLLLNLFVFKWEPIDFNLEKGNDSAALSMIKWVYRPRDKQADKEVVF